METGDFRMGHISATRIFPGSTDTGAQDRLAYRVGGGITTQTTRNIGILVRRNWICRLRGGLA